jgi:predicted secreted hydrolase
LNLPIDSRWAATEIYFAHFAVSDIAGDQFYAFQRFSRPGPGLAGAQADPYHVWLEDWDVMEHAAGMYRLQAGQEQVSIDLILRDEMGVVLHGENGYSRKGSDPTNASYYYSQPRLAAEGSVVLNGIRTRLSDWLGRTTNSVPMNWTRIKSAGTGSPCNSRMVAR